MITQTTCDKPSSANQMISAIKRLFKGLRGRSVKQKEHQLSESARMELALAIAEQYVLVSQDHPDYTETDTNFCALTMKSGGTQTLCSPITTCRSNKSNKRASSLISRMIRRPRTASYGSTVFELDQEEYYDPSFMVAASREQPLCC
ncbi:hypothetical protein EV178_004404 [Coemansia sp. RSA 1646]|nr:hypothetical protein EV178_004404 [Coemansia sp. RSA 1646]KAJ1769413.1 hypothetical protein LPJ74_004076 [Coemansia sp. RSA 1843]KAJ2087984.1 hypothetical protein IW138_004581 [Coemansia sp. RSA 986]